MGKTRKKRRRARPIALVPAYDLAEVKRLIREGKVRVVGQALRTAQDDFGWTTDEIVRFYLALKPSHFYKREYAEFWDVDWLDVYRAEMFGCEVYTHFFVNDRGELVIVNSFKRDASGSVP